MLEQTSIPSLRQKMISEALDYHQNMNSVVLNRMAKNIQVYENPSGKTDPSQQDLLVEGTIKQRIGEIQTNINRLNQTLSYTAQPQQAPLGPVSGSGSSEFVTGAIHHGLRRPKLEGSGKILPPKFSFDASTSNAKYVVAAVNYTAKLIRLSDKLQREGKDYKHVISAYIPMVNPHTSISAKDRIDYSETFLKAAEECADKGFKFTSTDFKAIKDKVASKNTELPKAEVVNLLEEHHEREAVTESDEEKEIRRPEGKKPEHRFTRRHFTGSGPPEFKDSEDASEYSAAAINYYVDALVYNTTEEGRANPVDINIDLVKPGAEIPPLLKKNLKTTFERCVSASYENKVILTKEDIKNFVDQVSSSNLPLSTGDINKYITNVKLPQIEAEPEYLSEGETGGPSSTTPVRPSRPSGSEKPMEAAVNRTQLLARQQREKNIAEAQERARREGKQLSKEYTGEEERPVVDVTPPLAPGDLSGVKPPVTRRGDSEPTAPGISSVISPDAKSSSKIKTVIDNYLTGIVSGYNSLIEYIEMQLKQRIFSKGQEQLTSQFLSELVEPLRLLIVNASQLRTSTPGLIDYTRVYNVISNLISKIQSSPPFQKVDISLLTEILPIRRDIIQASNFNPEKIANHEYLDELASRLNAEQLKLSKFSPKSPEEYTAREVKQREIQNAFNMLSNAGYAPTEQVYERIKKRVEDLEGTIAGYEFTSEEEAIYKEFEEQETPEVAKKEDLEIRKIRSKSSRVKQQINKDYAEAEAIMEELKKEDITADQRAKATTDLDVLDISIDEHKKKLEEYEREYVALRNKKKDREKKFSDLAHKVRPVFEKELKAAKEKPIKQAELAKSKAILEPYKTKFGKGKGVHKESADKFGDNSELEPYLTKYLRPSKYRNRPEEELSSSEESSGSDSEGPKKTGRGKRKTKKVIEDYEIIESQPKAEKGVLIEKKTRAKKGLGGKKPVHQARKESDLWFM